MSRILTTWPGVVFIAFLTTLAAIFVASVLAFMLYAPAHQSEAMRNTPSIAFLTAFPFCIFVWAQVRKNIHLSRELQRMVNRDRLTDVATRDFFFRHIGKISQCQGIILMVDIDHFKTVNDTHGHLAGDGVIQHTANVLRRNLRQSDIVARFGGEEFIVFLAKRDMESGLRVAERMRKAISAEPPVSDGTPIAVTVSIGGAQKRVCDSLEKVIKAADVALYAAKNAGRDRSVFADDVLPTAAPGIGSAASAT
ncbi:diguanylate cyclase (GGDEF) domain-containing protein [Cognatiyoonia koreensis]|uniref:diguanylate cyclase n=1 Tax=Cognatiyoonia koreensis TaxID=364200 RepID=A0A1I0NFI2_9RHOB|nr:GGDEF domain-containing protein [Cognatiyoonia koreensis]SEW00112.1 diguanylate cyclase (GGDEF) domain-containing protein [Cognatiyoonia koreensis]